MLTGTGGLGLPSGQRRAAAHPVIAELNPAECRELLAPGGVGRFLFMTDRGPVAVPVNYGMLGSDIVFRTSESAARPGPRGPARLCRSAWTGSTTPWPRAGACWP